MGRESHFVMNLWSWRKKCCLYLNGFKNRRFMFTQKNLGPENGDEELPRGWKISVKRFSLVRNSGSSVGISNTRQARFSVCILVQKNHGWPADLARLLLVSWSSSITALETSDTWVLSLFLYVQLLQGTPWSERWQRFPYLCSPRKKESDQIWLWQDLIAWLPLSRNGQGISYYM